MTFIEIIKLCFKKQKEYYYHENPYVSFYLKTLQRKLGIPSFSEWRKKFKLTDMSFYSSGESCLRRNLNRQSLV